MLEISNSHFIFSFQQEQIQNIRDSMVTSVSDEVKKLKEIIDKVQADNTRLKEENDSLKKKLSAAEDRIALLEKG